MKPLVSIVLPTHNRAHTIQKSVDSLLAQTYRDFEIIVVDDGSKDDTKRIVDDLMTTDSRIRYIRHASRRGANVARNRGVREATGKYIAFQDSDDQWLPRKLSIQMDAIAKTGIPVAFTSFWRIQQEKQTHIPKKWRRIRPGIRLFHRELLKGNFIALPTIVVERKLFHCTGGFDEELPRLQDWEMFLRLSKFTAFLYINQTLVHAYVGRDSITADKPLYRKSLEFIIQKHRRDFTAHPLALSTQYLNLAADALKSREYKETFDYIHRAFKPIVFK
ncbi:MAG: glycosyltransferase [Desulfobacterales bacterium]|nr:glycosyltransferase [Desulfobacterales bacterium]